MLGRTLLAFTLVLATSSAEAQFFFPTDEPVDDEPRGYELMAIMAEEALAEGQPQFALHLAEVVCEELRVVRNETEPFRRRASIVRDASRAQIRGRSDVPRETLTTLLDAAERDYSAQRWERARLRAAYVYGYLLPRTRAPNLREIGQPLERFHGLRRLREQAFRLVMFASSMEQAENPGMPHVPRRRERFVEPYDPATDRISR